MQLLKLYLNRELKTMHESGVRMRFIGDRARLSDDIRELVEKAEAMTQANAQFFLTVALSYGSRQELVNAVRHIAASAAEGLITIDQITEESLSHALYTEALPDPDLLIRTGGEQRLSNFLLWQSAYTELYFTPVLWPDFTAADLTEALNEFIRRERRYGNAN